MLYFTLLYPLIGMLKAILENYELGEPWKFGEKSFAAVVPILRRNAAVRSYVLLQEVKDELKVDIEDTGSISVAVVKNLTDKNVFVRKGTLLKGPSQERVVATGVVMLPEKTEEIKVQCIHRSRGIQCGAKFRAVESVVAPRPVMKALALRASQHETWGAVSQATSFLASAALEAPEQLSISQRASDDLVGVLEQTQKFRDEVENVLKKVPGDLNDQVGIAIIDFKGVVGLEIFDHPDSWHAFSKSVVRSYADVLAKESSELIELKLDKVKEAVISFIQKLGEAPGDVVYKNERSTTHALKGKEIAGEYTTLNTIMIHLVAFRIDEEDLRLRERERPLRRSLDLEWYGRERYQDSQYPQIPPYTTSGDFPGILDEFFRRKGSFQLLRSLNDKNKTWKDLEGNIPLSTKTLAKRLHEGQSLNLLTPKTRLENGRKTWRLTPKGKKALQYAAES